MAERKDLRLRTGWQNHQCEDGGFDEHRPVSDAELLDLLLPDIDWEALRGSVKAYETEGIEPDKSLMSLARRLLALHDGKDTE